MRRKSRRNSARELAEAKKAYDKAKVPIETLAERIKHVVQSSFNGKRIVIFSGGATVTDDQLLEEVRGINAGGGFGSIIGRNSFQRPHDKAIELLGKIMSIYAA